MRWLLKSTTVAVAALLASGTASALMIAFKPPVQRALSADVVVVGKVAKIEADSVMAEPYPGAKQKVAYKVAVVKIDTGLAGADKLKEIKVGFIPPPKVDPNANPPGGGIRPGLPRRPGIPTPELKEGQEFLFFLAKHPSGAFYMMPGMSPPVDMKDEQGKKELVAVKRITTTLADPMKSLKSDKPDVRAETATALVLKYRSYPEMGGEVDQVAIPAAESKLILKALTEGDWSADAGRGRPYGETLSPMMAFGSLGLTPKDGWIQPVIVNAPGAPPIDYNAVMKTEFAKWVEGPGKDFQINKLVPKKPVQK